MKVNAIAQEFNGKKLLKFSFPTIIMMVFLSFYTSVDGAFVSNFISEDALAALNIIYPMVNIFVAIGLMFATGANAIISKSMGEDRFEDARRFLSLIYIVGFLVSVLLGILVFIFRDEFLNMLGVTPLLYPYALEYITVLSFFVPVSILADFLLIFSVTAGKPVLGFWLIFLGGVVNIVLDYVLIVFLGMGMTGAALATGIGYSVPAILGIAYFLLKRNGSLYFVKPYLEVKKILRCCANGSSELVSNLSLAIVTLLFNISMLKYAGESGVAAITIILYVQFIQMAVYVGYSMGVSPIIGYKYGEENYEQLKKIIRFSLKFIMVSSIAVILLSIFGSKIAVGLFVSPNSEVFVLAEHGFIIFSLAYLFMGANIFISAMFTAFGNGKISALLSFLRTLVFIVAILYILPIYFGLTGIWLAVPLAEMLAFFVSLFFFIKYKKVYHY